MLKQVTYDGILNSTASITEHDTVSACILGGYGISPERTKSDNKQALLEEENKLPDNNSESRINTLNWISSNIDELMLDNDSEDINIIARMMESANLDGPIGLTQEMLMGDSSDE